MVKELKLETNTNFIVMNAEKLKIENNFFDKIIGLSILYHLITLSIVTSRKFSWFKFILKLLQNIDKFIFSLLPFLRKQAWQVVIIESEPK